MAEMPCEPENGRKCGNQTGDYDPIVKLMHGAGAVTDKPFAVFLPNREIEAEFRGGLIELSLRGDGTPSAGREPGVARIGHDQDVSRGITHG